MFLICLVLLIAGFLFYYDFNTFFYSNLADTESQIALQNLLLENGVPQESIDLLLSQINEFNSTPYRNLVETGWHKASIPFFSYKDSDGFTHLDTQPDNLINCRMTAFLAAKHSLSFGETLLTPGEEKDARSRQVLTGKADLDHYDLLYADLDSTGILSSDALIQSLTAYWQEAGISFADGPMRLIMAYGASSGVVQNFHSAVAIYEEDCIWLFEKYDPIHPYQLSRFDREEDMIAWIQKRVKGIEYAAIFSNDMCLWQRS